MRIGLAELAPVAGDVERNLRRVGSVTAATPADIVVFPELFLSGYRLGDRFQRLALDPRDLPRSPLADRSAQSGRAIVVGAPLRSAERPGEVQNAAVLLRPDRSVAVQVKRYLPTYGPFEEGALFSPTDESHPVDLGGVSVGLEICYDVFFPEVTRELALEGAVLLVAISASPVTSRRLFDKLLPARAVENAVPVVHVNRVGVEDGVVFGGGSGVWDARGEPVESQTIPIDGLNNDERVLVADVDLTDAPRWRPFRPVLRDRASRPSKPSRAPRRPWSRAAHRSPPTAAL